MFDPIEFFNRNGPPPTIFDSNFRTQLIEAARAPFVAATDPAPVSPTGNGGNHFVDPNSGPSLSDLALSTAPSIGALAGVSSTEAGGTGGDAVVTPGRLPRPVPPPFVPPLAPPVFPPPLPATPRGAAAQPARVPVVAPGRSSSLPAGPRPAAARRTNGSAAPAQGVPAGAPAAALDLLGLDRLVRNASEIAKRANAANPEGFDRQLGQIQETIVKGLPAGTPANVRNAVRVTCAQCRDAHLPALTGERAQALANGFAKTADGRDAEAAAARSRGDTATATRLEAEANRFRRVAEGFRPARAEAGSGTQPKNGASSDSPTPSAPTSGDTPSDVTPVADVRRGGDDGDSVRTAISRDRQDNRSLRSKEVSARILRPAPLVPAQRRAELRAQARRKLAEKSGLKTRARAQLQNDIAVVTNPSLSADARAAAHGRIVATLRRHLVQHEKGHRGIDARKSFKKQMETLDRAITTGGDVGLKVDELLGGTTLDKETARLVAEARHKAARARLKLDVHPDGSVGPGKPTIIRRHEMRNLAAELRGVTKMSDKAFANYLAKARSHIRSGQFDQFERVARAVRTGKILWFEGMERIVEDYAPHSSSENFLKSVFEIAPVSGEIISANDAFDAYDKAFTALDAGRRDLAIKHLTIAILATGGAVPIGGIIVRGGKKAAQGRIEDWLRGRLSDTKFAEWLKRQRDAWRARRGDRMEMTGGRGRAGDKSPAGEDGRPHEGPKSDPSPTNRPGDKGPDRRPDQGNRRSKISLNALNRNVDRALQDGVNTHQWKVAKIQKADDVNRAFPTYTDPRPAKPGTIAYSVVANGLPPRQFVRIHGANNPARPWFMRIDQVTDQDGNLLSIEEIRRKFAIPNTADKLSFVEVPKGTKVQIRLSIANPHAARGGGNIVQYEFITLVAEDWIKPWKNWKDGTWKKVKR